MVADHGLVAFGSGFGGGLLLRATVTRASLPLFCVVAGALLGGRGVFGWRMVQMVGAGLVGTALAGPLGMPSVDVMLLFTVALAGVAATPGRWRPVLLVVAVLQPATWPVGWSGYQPGLLVALLAIGTMLDSARLEAAGRRVPAVFAVVGRYPVSIYAGHLAAFAAAVFVMGGGRFPA